MSLPISLFQFENLVQNRVPFLFINLSVDLASLVGPIEREHLERYRYPKAEITAEGIMIYLSENKFPSHHAVLVLCDDGKASKTLSEQLTEQGLMNCFYILDGYRGLLLEKSSDNS
ncbi:MAG: hypothetical protein LW875_10165 [Proteobacteria bacterium]|jgi:hypothetical protein|nr:hypothetical protein [Pseudomonadota bacterium]